MFSIEEGIDPVTGLLCRVRRCRDIRCHYESSEDARVFGTLLDGLSLLPYRFQAIGPVMVDCARPYILEANLVLAERERHLLSAKAAYHPDDRVHLIRVGVAPMADLRSAATAFYDGEDAVGGLRRCMKTLADRLVERPFSGGADRRGFYSASSRFVR